MKAAKVKIFLVILFCGMVMPSLAKDFYWIGGSGSWTDTGHWSDKPGGISIGSTPGFEDNVYFTAESFTGAGQVVTVNTIAVCRNMTWNGVLYNPRFTTDGDTDHDLTIYGSLRLDPLMTFEFDNPIYFRASTADNVIDMQGQSFQGDIYFQNNGTWNVLGDLDISGKELHFEQGNLELNGEVRCLQFVSKTNSTRSLTMNSSTLILLGGNRIVWEINSEHLTLNAGTSKISIQAENSEFVTSGNHALSFYDLEFTGNNAVLQSIGALHSFHDLKFAGNANILGSHNCNNLELSSGSTYTLAPGQKQTVKGIFTALGDCSNFISILGDGGSTFLEASSVNLTNLKVKNVEASGGAFTAPESFDLGNTNGWDFTEPLPKMATWTGGAGDGKWSTPGNWSSGCVPTRIDEVTIDAASVNVDIAAECKNLSLLNAAEVAGSNGMNIFGSLVANGATWAIVGETHFSAVGSGVYTIDMGTNSFHGDVVFDGTETWELQSALNVSGYQITLTSGTLDTKSKELRCNQFSSTGEESRSLVLGDSQVYLEGTGERVWEVSASSNSFNLNAGTSTIQFSSESAGMYNNLTSTPEYHNVIFSSPNGQALLINENAIVRFEQVEFVTGASIQGTNSFVDLILSAGAEYLFEAGKRQTIIGGIYAEGTCSEYIILKGQGGEAEIFSDVDLTINMVKLENMKASSSSGTTEHTAHGAIDLGGNTGWIITEPGTRNLHWSGGAGDSDWFNRNNWAEKCVPTRVDNVFFDAADLTSSVLTVAINDDGPVAECLSMNWNGAHALAVLEGAGELKIYGSLDFSGLNDLKYSGKIYFKSKLDEEIRLGGNILSGAIHFEGREKEDGTWEAGSWTLKDEFHSIASITLERGGLVTDNNTLTAEGIHANFSDARFLTLGSSEVKLQFIELSPENLTFDAGTSQLNFIANGSINVSDGATPVSFYNVNFAESSGLAQVVVRADDVSFNQLVFACNANFQEGGFTAKSLALAQGKTYLFQEDAIYDLGDLIASGGCEGFIDLSTFTSGLHTTFNSKDGKNIIVEGMNLLDIHAEGASFTANNSIGFGNTDGWTINDKGDGIDLYWVGGTGDWDDKNHWATTSGGTGGECLPTAFDNVFFDVNSFSGPDQTVYASSNDIRCKSMDWTGATGTPNFVSKDDQISGIYIHGSLTFIKEMNIDLPNDMNFYFRAMEAGQKIQSGDYLFPNDIKFEGVNGEWTLEDDLKTEGKIILENGALIADGNDIECLGFESKNTISKEIRVLDIQNSQLILQGYNDQAMVVTTFEDQENDLTFELKADGSTLVINNSGSIFFSGVGEHSFNNVVFNGDAHLTADIVVLLKYNNLILRGDGTFVGEHHFTTLELGRGNSYVFQEGVEYPIETNLIAEGSCNFPISIESSKPGSEAILSKASGTINMDYAIMKDIHAKNTGADYIATNSIDNGNNTGWTISDLEPKTLYWVGHGATDEWEDYENWSTESGGTAEGCVPSSIDDVIFDVNSFLGSKIVNINSEAYCHNMTWMDEVDPGATFNVNSDLEVKGSLDFTDNMSVNFKASLLFTGDGEATDKKVDLASKSLDGTIVFEGNDQTWKLESALNTSAELFLKKGYLDTQDHDLMVARFESVDYDTKDLRKLELGNSIVQITNSSPVAWNMVMVNADGDLNMEFHSDISSIEFMNGGGFFCQNKKEVLKFNDLIFYDNGKLEVKGGSGEFNIVSFKELAEIKGSNTFESLELTIGYHNTIQAGHTQTILTQLIMEGVSCEKVELKSDEPGNAAFVSKSSGEVNIYNARLKDIHAVGAADFWVIGEYEDEGNNDNWTVKIQNVEDEDEEEAPSWGFDNPVKEEFCSSTAVIDEVLNFPINKLTSYQWYQDKLDGAGYQPIPGATNPIIEITESGFYQVEVIYNDECKPIASIEVVINTETKMTLELTRKDLRCYNDGRGQVSVIVNDGYPDYIYKWTDAEGNRKGENSSTLYGLDPGKYYVTVLDSKGCEKSGATEVFNAYPLNIDKVEKIDVTCFGENQGTIAITANGGTGSLHYYLNDAVQAGSIINDLVADTYSIYVLDDNDCKVEAPDEMITQPDEILYDWLASGLGCNGDGDGQIDPQVKGGVAPYNYSWTGPLGFSSTEHVISKLSGGNYTLTVRDQKNCEVSRTYNLIEPDPLVIDAQMTKEVDCYGNGTGEVWVKADQGRLPYTFKLGEFSNTDGIFKGLTAGNYDVEVIDNGGCSQLERVEVTEPFQLELMVDDAMAPGCTGTRNGEIKVTALDGKGGYSYSWSGPNDFRSIEKNINGLEAGLYQLRVLDRNNCEVVKDIDLQEKPELQLGLRVKQDVSEAGAADGVLIIEMLGGHPEYSFTCTGPEGFNYTSPANLMDNTYKIENLQGGIYTVTLSDASGCGSLTRKVMLEEPGKLLAYISSSSNISCSGSDDGQLKVSMSGGDGNYTINWVGPGGFVSSQNIINGLKPGVYTVQVTSAGVTVSDNIEVIEPAPLDASIISKVDLTCNGNPTGLLELDIKGGSTSYNVLWEGPNGFLSRATKLIQLEAGDYSYVVNDANNCEVSGNATIVQPDVLEVLVSSNNVSAAGQKDGDISVAVSGGTQAYTYYITGPDNYSKMLEGDVSGSYSVSGLKHGLYRVEVEDANGCTWVEEVSVVEPGRMLISVAGKTDLECYGAKTGAIDLQVDNGSGDYSFSWTGPDYFQSELEDPIELIAGSYQVEVIDNGTNEKQSLEVEIQQPQEVKAEYIVKDVSCNGASDGYINIFPLGGTSPYSYNWTGSVSDPSEEDQRQLNPGLYEVTVTDAKGCASAAIAMQVREPQTLAVDYSSLEPSCYGFENGAIQLKPEFGTSPYRYSWKEEGSILGQLSELTLGEYQYAVWDKNGCYQEGQVTLSQPDSLMAEITEYNDILCYGDGDGRAMVNVSGGTEAYQYNWSDGQTEQEVTNLGKGEYKVVVTDAHDCVDSARVSIAEPEPLVVNIETIRPTTLGSEDGKINLDVKGGTPSYRFDWEPVNQIDSYLTDLNAGDYRALISDYNNCQLDTLITLENLFDDRIAIPKAFTPNDDGYNDHWKIDRVQFVKQLQIAVYDRWGKVIFKFDGSGTDYQGQPWDGRNGSKELPMGAYYYAIQLDNDKPILGSVTILH